MVSRASEGRAARRCSGSGRIQSPHDGRRCRTSSGLTPRRSGRCCRLSVAVPPPTALRFFAPLERFLRFESDRDSRTHAPPGAATGAVRLTDSAAVELCAEPGPTVRPGRTFTFMVPHYLRPQSAWSSSLYIRRLLALWQCIEGEAWFPPKGRTVTVPPPWGG